MTIKDSLINNAVAIAKAVAKIILIQTALSMWWVKYPELQAQSRRPE